MLYPLNSAAEEEGAAATNASVESGRGGKHTVGIGVEDHPIRLYNVLWKFIEECGFNQGFANIIFEIIISQRYLLRCLDHESIVFPIVHISRRRRRVREAATEGVKEKDPGNLQIKAAVPTVVLLPVCIVLMDCVDYVEESPCWGGGEVCHRKMGKPPVIPLRPRKSFVAVSVH